jgi:hypothetical protein
MDQLKNFVNLGRAKTFIPIVDEIILDKHIDDRNIMHKNDGIVYYPHDYMKMVPPNSNTFRPIHQVDNILKINGYGRN